ncbi:MAG: GPI ethanolamine phosphate transferase 2 [Lasallia pustulata]|uniref:GPI ethanolamine phosphate transferase 2 n=1 Tax=Lasallia pustulata TaxID=136370 RepID=A0A5M8PTL1_9LECA|nr:MAG: GPI ethanolamine phosphate transferase 2 [Lasallia pustulata]
MAVIWGLDLREMQWGKFKSSYMFNTTYYLRRTKMIIYQCAMILCVCSESVGTAALSDYVDQQSFIESLDGNAAVHNDDIVGIASYNIFVGVAIATIFGAAFFFDLFWPERHESASVHLAWKICAVIVSGMALADAIGMSVIVASRGAYVTGVSHEQAQFLLDQYHKPPLSYKHDAECVASVVLLWLGWVSTVASTFILFASHAHDAKFGPFAAHSSKAEVESVEMAPEAAVTRPTAARTYTEA